MSSFKIKSTVDVVADTSIITDSLNKVQQHASAMKVDTTSIAETYLFHCDMVNGGQWSGGGLSVVASVIFSFLVLFTISLFVVYLIGKWKTFEKADQPGWTALIPIYNLVITLRIINKPLWWLILYLIPGAGMIMRIVVLHHLSQSFGKDAGYTLGLYFIPTIFYPILGFGDAKYEGPSGVV